ncbi:MAG: flagellar hook-basal body complex protein FliE [Candidatus Omnitrophica bacterium]|nr:flagellar hook-basal body complex protein FliE [Candidatus Omnitrophota bacterium]
MMPDPLGPMPSGPSRSAPTDPTSPGELRPREPAVPGPSFVELLKRSIYEVNQLQDQAGDKVQKLVTGEISNIHEVMIATEEAGIALNLLLQIRNQLLQAWDELKRISV